MSLDGSSEADTSDYSLTLTVEGNQVHSKSISVVAGATTRTATLTAIDDSDSSEELILKAGCPNSSTASATIDILP